MKGLRDDIRLFIVRMIGGIVYVFLLFFSTGHARLGVCANIRVIDVVYRQQRRIPYYMSVKFGSIWEFSRYYTG